MASPIAAHDLRPVLLAAEMDRRSRPIRACRLLAARDCGPEVPPGLVVSVAWRLDGAGKIIGGLLPHGHPHGGPRGKRILHGEGVWAAEMYPCDRKITEELDLVEPGPAARPARIVVHGPEHDIVGYVDQPRLPADRFARATTGLRRDARQIRIRAAERIWWLRATKVFGVRVIREDGVGVYQTRGLHAVFSEDADHLDVSVVLLTLASIPSSAYAPILGF
ncbi:conserved hypothetical protein [Frankia sp. AgKG'84/4]